EKDGQTPKFVKQFAAIGGSADEKLPMPQGMADDLQKYSKYDPRLKGAAQLSAGQEVSLTSLLSAYKYLTEDKGREADGWKDPEGKSSVSVNGKIMQHNPFTSETREYPGGIPQGALKEQADITLKGAETKKNLAEAAKAKQADKPVYAFNTQTRQLEQTTRGAVAENSTLYTNPVEVKESDIRKDTELARQLGDAQLNLSRYRVA